MTTRTEPGRGGDQGLRRSLGFRDLVVYGLLFIAPMAPVGVFGALDGKSRGAVALVYVVATVAMAFTAYSYAQMVRVAPRAGSVFSYARVSLGEHAGFVAGWMALLDYLLIPAVAYLFSGIAMEALVPAVDQWVWTAIAVVVTTALNLSGVRAAALVGFLVLAMEIAVLLVFVGAAGYALATDGPQRGWLSPLSGEDGFSLTTVLSAVSVAVLSYLGFDAIATFAEETKRRPGPAPRLGAAARLPGAATAREATAGGPGSAGGEEEAGGRQWEAAERPTDGTGGTAARGVTADGSVPAPSAVGDGESARWVARAVITCLALTGVLFVLQTYLAELLSPVSADHLAAHPSEQDAAFYDAVDSSVGGWLHDLVAVSKAIGAAFAALAGQAAAGRLLFAMARDRRLPGPLATVARKSRVPRLALLSSAVVTLLAAVWAARRDDGLDRLVSIVSVGALTAFALLHAAVVGWFWVRRGGTRRSVLRHLLLPLVGLAIVVAVIVMASGTARVVGAGWLGVGLVVLVVQGGRRGLGTV